ncbi:MAG TPA: hypothetical protein VGX25_34060 [Actinophytocola sp.]|uniref:hypothetical protein n=1 Tax=Actinophytocola sp. TaxID=1872138 RepID=UPI002DDD001B|nr:hypothetical protein [Actinophytocola sp.]HEV2784440.1 hypothetical protein [Actinophytocola sp.]
MDKPFGFWTAVGGLGVLALITLVAIFRYPSTADATDVITAAGAVIGTVIGAFFGVQTGAAGRAKAEEGKDQAMAALVRVAALSDSGSPAARAAREAFEETPTSAVGDKAGE